MKTFPVLESVEPVLRAIADRSEFGVFQHAGTSLATISYNVCDRNTFADEMRCEARCLVFDTVTKQIVIRGFHKFFNVGERPETQISVLQSDFDSKSDFQTGSGFFAWDKTDGMMVSASVYGDDILYASKRALLNDPWYSRADALVRAITKHHGNVSVMFERTYKKLETNQQHLLEYADDYLVLLAIRDNRTGEYYSTYDWDHETHAGLHVESGDIRLQDYEIFNTFKELLDAQLVRQNIEGWVLYRDGNFYKLKTEWYLRRHHIIGNLSERSIAKMVLGETYDDAISFLRARYLNTPILDRIEETALRVKSDYDIYLHVIDTLVAKYDGVSNRELVTLLDKGDLWYINQRRKSNSFDWAAQFFKEFKERYSCVIFYKEEVDND